MPNVYDQTGRNLLRILRVYLDWRHLVGDQDE